jgi:hypothetical protein
MEPPEWPPGIFPRGNLGAQGRKKKDFFFEKKKQKTFAHWRT